MQDERIPLGKPTGTGEGFERPDVPLFEVAPALAAEFEARGIATRTVRHDPVFTVGESRDLRGRIPGGHTKNLFLKDKKGRLFLVVAEEDHVVDLKTLHTRIGAQGRLSFAGAEPMLRHLGVEPGSVTAFGLICDRERHVTLVLDRGLLAHDILNCHPLTNRATTSIARDDLLALFAATGHDPLVVRLEADTADPSSGRS